MHDIFKSKKKTVFLLTIYLQRLIGFISGQNIFYLI